jgi:N-acetylneuraminic acid mutarotase
MSSSWHRLVYRSTALLVVAAVLVVGGGAAAAPRQEGLVQATVAPWRLAAPVAREIVVSDTTTLTVLGGIDASRASTPSVQVVRPATGTTRLGAALPEAVHDAAGVRLGRTIRVFGGGGPSENGTADVQEFPRARAPAVVGRLPRPRSDHVAAVVGSKTYILGGFDGTGIVAEVLTTNDGLTFSTVANLPIPVRYPAAAVVGRAIYLFGGVDDSAAGTDTTAVQRLDTRTGKIDVVAQLPTSLSHASAVVLARQVYVLGGYVDNTRLSDRILRFDPRSNQVTVAGRLPSPISDGAAATVGGRGYLVGGQGDDRAPLATVIVLSVS